MPVDAVFGNLDRYVESFGVTLLLLLVSGAAALVLGSIIAVMRISPIGSLRVFGTVYTEIVRNTPLALVLFFCAYVLPILGVRMGYIYFAFIGLSVYTSPFVAEALRSGINGVPIGQAEAARSLGLGFRQSVGSIILPQAFRMVIPPLINVFIALTKNTSVASGFFVFELVALGKELANAHGNAVIPVLLGVAVFYLVITVPLGIVASRLERRWVVTR